MLQLELPHINVLSKIDLLSSYGELPFDLRYYTEVQDLSYLLDSLDQRPRMAKFKTLNKAMVELVEEYGMVGFETLAVEVCPYPCPPLLRASITTITHHHYHDCEHHRLAVTE